MLTAELRQMLAGDHSDSAGEDLKEKPCGCGEEEDPGQLITRVGARLQIALEIAGIDVGDGHQPTRTRVGPQETPGKEGRGRTISRHLGNIHLALQQRESRGEKGGTGGGRERGGRRGCRGEGEEGRKELT